MNLDHSHSALSPESTTTTTHAPSTAPGRRAPALASLWASAFVIAALIITQAGRLGPLNPAYAEMASEGTDYSLMTTQGGNEENLYVLDSRGGKIFVYEPSPNEGLILHDVQNVAEMITRLQRRPGN